MQKKVYNFIKLTSSIW